MNRPKFKMKDYEESIKKMQNNIVIHKDDIWTPPNRLKMNEVKTNSWFSILEIDDSPL